MSFFQFDVEAIIILLNKGAAFLTVSIEYQTIALCINARLSGDVTQFMLQEKSYISSYNDVIHYGRESKAGRRGFGETSETKRVERKA